MANLDQKETTQLICLLAKAAPRADITGSYTIIVTPTIYSPEDFIPRKKVCVDSVDHVVGEVNLEDAMDQMVRLGSAG